MKTNLVIAALVLVSFLQMKTCQFCAETRQAIRSAESDIETVLHNQTLLLKHSGIGVIEATQRGIEPPPRPPWND